MQVTIYLNIEKLFAIDWRYLLKEKLLNAMEYTGPVLLGPGPTEATCPLCKAHINTTVKYTHNANTYIAAGVWGRICRCCCIPFMCESAQNSDHYCTNCNSYIGTYRK